MAIITFMSDFGMSDHYVSAVKAKILSINPGLRIFDINHNIEPFNIAHAAHVLKSVFRDFPIGTVHLIAVNSHEERNNRYLTAKMEEKKRNLQSTLPKTKQRKLNKKNIKNLLEKYEFNINREFLTDAQRLVDRGERTVQNLAKEIIKEKNRK